MNRDHLADLFMPGIRGKINQLNELTQYLENIPAAIRNYSGWQPIETAPKDGRHILVYSNDRIVSAYWSFSAEDWADVLYGDIMQPTHWQPLPKPPQEEI